MSAAAARALVAEPAPERTGRRRKTPYRTICTTCLLEFTSKAAEDRHVAPGHNRFELVLE